jgi:hypothetical protein
VEIHWLASALVNALSAPYNSGGNHEDQMTGRGATGAAGLCGSAVSALDGIGNPHERL